MGRKPSINYDEYTVTCNGKPCEAALFNYYSILIDFLIKKYGSEPVRIALEELIAEEQ
ncbi:hypothetical protein [Clostridium neonatale]|uniref:Uncharacterized protein n=1 Tax=Siphoviridae sp. ct3gT1 TaxID=2825323 RepID=A0A8S5UJN8_9CAUD|nr:conserved hypothetical protein [Clostridium neonatale]DAF94582.1 MAG TPA: hypothetical protein [Siphoviridae sp. ct3gT1]